MPRTTKLLWFTAATALSALAHSSDASACGGCFAPPVQGNDSGTIVTSHRMVMSVSTDRSILWDQFQYTGAPAEFAWVLPVKPGAVIEVGSEAFFDVLDAATGTQVAPPLLSCYSPGFFGCQVAPGLATGAMGCGASEGEGSDGNLLSPDPVQVVSHGATGPYESVVIHSDVPGALTKWLTDHQYTIPADVAPVIEAYQKEGFDFAALRLLPSAGVNQMRPVRVIQKGSSATLPLRMVAAGTGPYTAVTLFVIGEGRYTTQNLPEIVIPREQVIWDYTTGTSNYASLRNSLYSKGHSFFAAYAEPDALFSPITNPTTGFATHYQTTTGTQFATFADAFVEQAFINGETSSTDCRALWTDMSDEDRKVTRCDPEDPNCFVDPDTQVDARNLECDPPLGSDIPLDDLAQALAGMHPSDVWVTRLEANLARSDLANDLILSAAPAQEPVPGAFTATKAINLPNQCKFATPRTAAVVGPDGGDDKGPPKTDDDGTRRRLGPVITLGAIGLLFALRRLRASRKTRAILGAPAEVTR
ncbi:MAG: DUF2330 domain-containing protein [Polyangiaceae bacterium]